MKLHLVVTRTFLGFVRGDVIADASRIGEILATDYRRFVMRVTAPTTSKG